MESKQYSYDLSLIIPFYNEESRISLLFEGLENFERRYKNTYEVVLVNDGSKDQTESKLREHAHFKSLEEKGCISIINLPGNSGKGGALQKGVESSKGEFILTLDFDMATDPMTIEDWKKSKGGKYQSNEIWIGSRPHPKSQLQEKPLRKLSASVRN